MRLTRARTPSYSAYSAEPEGASMIRAALILVFLGCTLFAQQIFTNSTVNFDATGGIRATFSALTGNPGAVVTGAPFSADRVTEHVQTLADGTHIRPEGTT